MADRPQRVAMVGLGGVAIGHLEGYRGVDEIQVVAGADIQPARAKEMAARYGFTPYTDYREMLDRERPDIVCVLTTVRTHREVVEAAADRGIHILCEKPIAITLEDADAMIAKCQSAGVQLFYAASYRFLPPLITARQLIRDGAIGEVRTLMETLITGSGVDRYREMGPAHYPAGGPGGPGFGIVDHGIHLVDIFGWLMGSQVTRVHGKAQISGAPPVSEYMMMEFANGAVGHLQYDSATWAAEIPTEGLFSWAPGWGELAASTGPIQPKGQWQEQPPSIKVYGTRGALRIYHYANQLFLRTEKGIEQIQVANHPMPAQFAAELRSLIGTIRRQEPPEVTGEDGRRALAAVLGVYRSMDTGAVERV